MTWYLPKSLTKTWTKLISSRLLSRVALIFLLRLSYFQLNSVVNSFNFAEGLGIINSLHLKRDKTCFPNGVSHLYVSPLKPLVGVTSCAPLWYSTTMQHLIDIYHKGKVHKLSWSNKKHDRASVHSVVTALKGMFIKTLWRHLVLRIVIIYRYKHL